MKKSTKALINLLLALTISCSFSGCFLTKLLTVPMRVVGAATSIIPVVGNSTHDAIDGAAEMVDEVPI